MTRRIAVLRPEPGNAATVARCRAMGIEAMALPLFEIMALDWQCPQARDFDALLLTSANAVRSAGSALADLRSLPVLAVGEATARAARAAGLEVAMTGTSDARALIDQAAASGIGHALHLGGQETTITVEGIVARSIAVYASVPRPIESNDMALLKGATALLHSARAAARLGELLDQAGIARRSVAIATISSAVADAAGAGWAAVAIAPTPDDHALIHIAAALEPPGD